MKKTMLTICATLVVCVLALALSKTMGAQVNGRTPRIPSAPPPSQRQWEYAYDAFGYEFFTDLDNAAQKKIEKRGIDGWELADIVREVHENQQGQKGYFTLIIYKRPK